MISFRFHVVSITAVFLAIAIGIVIGSTYVDRAIVENLRERVESVSDNLDERRAEIAQLEEDLGEANDYIDASADFAVTERLAGQPVLLVAPRGAGAEAVEQMAALARRAGARVPGVLWLEPAWALAEEDERGRLAELVGARADDDPGELRREAWDDVVAELSSVAAPAEGSPDPAQEPAQDPATTTSEPHEPPATPALDSLQDAGFVTLDPLDDTTVGLGELAGTGPRVLVVTGSEVDGELRPVVGAVADAATRAELPTVVADVYVEVDGGPDRAQQLRELLSEAVAAQLVLVDDADQVSGRVAAILALASTDSTPGAHYGEASGADGRLPVWTSP